MAFLYGLPNACFCANKQVVDLYLDYYFHWGAVLSAAHLSLKGPEEVSPYDLQTRVSI